MKDTYREDLKGDILLVDDTPDNLRLLSAILTRQGFAVRKALSGQRALFSAQTDPPDLILLDIKMPEMSGYQVCQRLKDDPKTREVPIIFISALDDAMDKVQAFAVGGTDYITKPFQEAEVLARIENQLRIQRLQRQLVQQNQELVRSNRDLEQFAYVVSHDLQQPLQSVTGFIRLLQLKYQDDLDGMAHEYLSRIHEAGERMQRLIQDLLTYAQMGQEPPTLQPLDCNQLLAQVLENLQAAIAEKQAQIHAEPLPSVMGNETQLIQLFQNLLSNAIKFVPPDRTPTIHITVEPQTVEKPGDRWLFQIQDNGIGIAPQNLDKIFHLFQRTETTQQYPGTGIGLATCKKIIENHRGTLGVTSQLDGGTTFYFTLESVREDSGMG